MLSELVSRALVALWLLAFGLWFAAPPHKLPKARPAGIRRRQWAAAAVLPGKRVLAVRLQIAIG